MFRGFRLHLLALILAATAFAFAAVYRVSRVQQVQPTVTAVPATSQGDSTPTLTAAPVEQQSFSTPDARSPATNRAQYREGLVGTVQRLNPVFAHLNPVDRDISSLIFEGLFATNEYGAPILRLAENLTISGDNLEYVVELRKDVRWQDGIAFSAEDVIYTMSLLSDPEYAAFSPSAKFWHTVETQKLSDHLVRFRLAQPLASFTRLLTIGILPEHALRGTTVSALASHPFNLSPIGTGPYQVGELRTDQSGKIGAILLHHSTVYEARSDAENAFQLRELLFDLYSNANEALQGYRSGEVDVLANVGTREQLLALPRGRLNTSVDSTLRILIFNWDVPLFQDRRMRRALALILDHVNLIETHMPGHAIYANSPLIPGMPVYQPNAFWETYDPALAASLVETAPIAQVDEDENDASEGEGASPVAFTLLVEDSTSSIELALDIAVQWRELGLEFEVASVEPDGLMQRLHAGDFAAAVVSQHIGAEPDVYRFWHPAQTADGLNYGSVSQNEIAEILDSARRGRNGIARHHMYQQFQEIFAEKAIAIPLYYPLFTMIVRDSIEGVQLGYLGNAADRFRGISSWRFATSTS